MENSSLNQYFLSFSRELSVASEMLRSGLHTMRSANFMDNGKFGSAFFSLTIAIERICKLILIRQYQRENHGSIPDNQYIRKFSHSIRDLINEVTREKQTNYILHDELIDDIIAFLSNFAKSIRYYNLDALTKQLPTTDDPLFKWSLIQNRILDRHFPYSSLTEREDNIIDFMNDVALIRYTDLDGNLIDSPTQFFIKGKQIECLQKYSVLYIHRLAEDLVKIGHDEQYANYILPVFHEFFPEFVKGAMSKQQILRKKKWN